MQLPLTNGLEVPGLPLQGLLLSGQADHLPGSQHRGASCPCRERPHAHEIGAITGHASLSELVRYTKAADQRRLAEVAMTKTRTSDGKPAPRVAKKAEKSLQLNVKKQMS